MQLFLAAAPAPRRVRPGRLAARARASAVAGHGFLPGTAAAVQPRDSAGRGQASKTRALDQELSKQRLTIDASVVGSADAK